MTTPVPLASVSACLIVRNEARRLARCLSAVAPWVGELVVVDTGSTDATVAIAESFGARVLHRPWQDDFAWARNQALDAATRPWALVVDADEVFTVTSPDGLQKVVAPAQADIVAYSLDCHDLRDDGAVGVAPVLRLFRRDLRDMRYQGEVHEQVVGVALHGVPVVRADFAHLLHDGYTAAVMAEHGTRDRNVPLARKMVAARPADPFAWFCLGQSLSVTDAPGALAETVLAYQRALVCFGALGLARDESYLVSLYLGLVRGLMRLGQATEAETVAQQGLSDFPASPDLRHVRGMLLAARGQHGEAAAEFEICLGREAQEFFVREEPGAAGFSALTQLGLCRVRQGDLRDAERCFSSAVAQAPRGFPLPSLLLATLLLGRGAAVQAEALLRVSHAALPDDLEIRLKWVGALLQLGRLDDAESALMPVGSNPRARTLADEIRRRRQS